MKELNSVEVQDVIGGIGGISGIRGILEDWLEDMC